MTKLAEQSNVPLVFIRKIVGMPAFASMTRGEYPPLAVMSTYCTPPTIVAVALPPPPPDERADSQNAPPTRRTLNTIEMMTGLFIALDVEQRIDYTCCRERIREIEQGKRDNDDTRRFEKYPLPRLVRDIERAERKEREYGKGAERKDEHRECAVHEAPRGERVELHRLGKSARENERADADEERREVVVA